MWSTAFRHIARGRHAPMIGIASLLVIAALTVAIVTAGAEGRARPLALTVVGRTLVNGQGDLIRLLGVDRSGAEYPCIAGWGIFDGPTNRRSVAAMKAWRVNAVRIPLNEDCWLGINGVSPAYGGARYRSAIRSYVRLLNDAGLYVILDLHWSAPGAKKATVEEEMADLDHSPAFWSSVARTFRHDRAVVFDLFNEPHAISWPCWRDGCWISEGWHTAGMQTLVDAVRRTGARQPIIATGLNWGNDLTAWTHFRPHDPARQLVAGFHAFNFTACTKRSCWVETVGRVARKVPVVTTELGEGDCSHQYIDRFMRWADAVGVSYLGWSWNPTGCAALGLISSWNGSPTRYGAALRAHLLTLAHPHRKGGTGR
jgi:endoglucanase